MNKIKQDSIQVEQISAESTVDIRHEVLWPHKEKNFCLLQDDNQGIHFGAFYGHKLVGVASLFLDEDFVRLRKFAIKSEYQNKGIGTCMIQHLINFSKESLKATQFWFDARVEAIQFYKRFDFKSFGEKFMKEDKQFIKMKIDF